MDYGKFKYENAKRERDAKKNKKSQELKEVKFRPKTGHDHDFDFKVKHARRFLEEGQQSPPARAVSWPRDRPPGDGP